MIRAFHFPFLAARICIRLAAIVLFFLACLPCQASPALASAPYQPDSGNLSIRCGVLIDGISDTPRIDQRVVIRSGRIQSVQDAGGVAADLDLSGYTCLPGLIDMHTHITDRANDSKDLSVYYTRSDAETAGIANRNAQITLDAGFTTIRNVGAYVAWSACALRDRINRGEVPGPRVLCAGVYLTIPGGGGDLVIPGIDEKNIPARVRMGVARGPEQFREKAELAVQHGVDLLKVIASGAVLAYGGIPGAPEMTEPEIAAVVDVAHRAGLRVAAHAHGAQSIKDAIRAGVDTIEHASLADDEAIAMAAKKQVAFSMDVYDGDYIAAVGKQQGWPEEFLRKNEETTEAQREVFTKAWHTGVPMVFGTDAAVYPHGDQAKQFPIMVQRGMAPMDVIRAASSVAARYLGWDDRVGAVAPGRFGDLIAVKGDPLRDISVLGRVAVVVKGGLLFKMAP